MRRFGLALSGLLLWAASSYAQSVAAQPAAAREPIVVLVMESGGGVRAALALRAALNQRPPVRVLSSAEASQEASPPFATMTVASDAKRLVSVRYWDCAGNTDTLAAVAPAGEGQVDVVAQALASALLDRHRAELTAENVEGPPTIADYMRNSSALYAMFGRFSRASSRTNVQLRVEDF